MEPANYARPCRKCLASTAWLAIECDACGYRFSPAEVRGARAMLEQVADQIALRYEPGTPRNAEYLAEQAELERFIAQRPTSGSVTPLRRARPRLGARRLAA